MTLSPRAIEAAAKAAYDHEPIEKMDLTEIPWSDLTDGTRDRFKHKTTAAIAAYLAAREAEGFVEVPVNDLRAVVNLARQADDCIETECIAEYLKDRAMLTAAQNGGEDAGK